MQNQKENSKYLVLNDIKFDRSKQRYLKLENCKTQEQTTIQIGWHEGERTILISEEILSNVDISPKYLYATKIGNVILVEEPENKNS